MPTSTLRSRLLVAIIAAVVPLQVVDAQLVAPKPDTAQGAPLFNGRDVIRAVGFAGLTVAMFPLDRSIARRLTNARSIRSIFAATLRNQSCTLTA